MRKYKHWLVLDMLKKDKGDAQDLVKELIDYQNQRGSTIKLYHRDSGTFEHIFSVETEQNYNDLDLSCNGMFNSFYHLSSKPKNIHKGKDFKEYIKRYEVTRYIFEDE